MGRSTPTTAFDGTICLYNVVTLNICMKEFGLEIFFDKMTASLIGLLYMHRMVPSWADQLLPQLLMEQFDTLPIQYRHIEHMHEGGWLKFFF